MYDFKVVTHSILPGSQVVEVWRNGVFIAGVYPHEDGIRVVSKYMTDVIKETEPVMARGNWLPTALVKLGKKPVRE